MRVATLSNNRKVETKVQRLHRLSKQKMNLPRRQETPLREGLQPRMRPCPPSDKVCRVIYYRGLCRRVQPTPTISKMRKQPSRKTQATRCALPAMRAEPAGDLRDVRKGFPRPSRVLGLFSSPAASCRLLYDNFFLTHRLRLHALAFLLAL